MEGQGGPTGPGFTALGLRGQGLSRRAGRPAHRGRGRGGGGGSPERGVPAGGGGGGGGGGSPEWGSPSGGGGRLEWPWAQSSVSVVVNNLKICCSLGDVSHTSPEMRNSAWKMLSPQGGLFRFQVQTALEPAAARAISRRTRFEGETSADEAYIPGSGAVQVSGRWKRAVFCPTTRSVRKTHKEGCETRTAMIHLDIPAV